MIAAVGAIIWYSISPEPPVTFVTVIEVVLVEQSTGVLLKSKSNGGVNESIVISLVINAQSFTSLIVTV